MIFSHSRRCREHDNAGKAVVFIHGLMGSPSQFDDLAASAFLSGCSIVSVLLPGHGGGVRDFIRFGAKDWQACVQSELDGLKDRYRSVFLVGHSIGGLLALNACLIPENRISGVLLISTPLKFNVLNPQSLLMKLRLIALPKNSAVRAAYRSANSVAISNPLLYPLALRPVFGAFKLARETKRILADISVPVCMFHSRNDETTSYKSARLLLDGLGNTPVAAYELKSSRHAYYDAKEREIIKARLLEMLGGVLPG